MASPRTELRFPPDGGYYVLTTGYDFDGLTRDNDAAALAKVEQAMTPATMDQCEGWLVMLQSATAHRSETDAANSVAYALYASELRQWPADVAKKVCADLARGVGVTGTNWFPTLADVVKRCERLTSPRKALYRALGGR